MLAAIRQSSPTGREAAEIVAASSNQSDGRAAPAALTAVASTATAAASQGFAAGSVGRVALVVRSSRSVVVVTPPISSGLRQTVSPGPAAGRGGVAVAAVTGAGFTCPESHPRWPAEALGFRVA